MLLSKFLLSMLKMADKKTALSRSSLSKFIAVSVTIMYYKKN